MVSKMFSFSKEIKNYKNVQVTQSSLTNNLSYCVCVFVCMCAYTKGHISVQYCIPPKSHISLCLLDAKDIGHPAAPVCWQSGMLRGQLEDKRRSEIERFISIHYLLVFLVSFAFNIKTNDFHLFVMSACVKL